MLFSADSWPGLADGSITLTFRTWTRAQAKPGGRYRVAGMLLEATEVRQVAVGTITERDARAAGAADLASLRARLGNPAPAALVWRVGLRYLGIDDRIERREDDALTPEQIDALRRRLDRFDQNAPAPWTRLTLRLIQANPGVVSTDLAPHTGQDRPTFKLNVRKLKELGLTESLDVGYRISPRGAALLQAID